MSEAIYFIKDIITNILATLYQPFWYVITLTFFVSVFYLASIDSTATGKGVKEIIKYWYKYFKTSSHFRSVLFVIFLGVMILSRTIYYRSVWVYPLQDVMGGWWIWKVDNSGEKVLTTECFENILLMLPFTFALLYSFEKKLFKKFHFINIVFWSAKTCFFFSLLLEMIQLVFRLGTFQLSDLFYNTLGGFLGALVYCVFKTLHNAKDS